MFLQLDKLINLKLNKIVSRFPTMITSIFLDYLKDFDLKNANAPLYASKKYHYTVD